MGSSSLDPWEASEVVIGKSTFPGVSVQTNDATAGFNPGASSGLADPTGGTRDNDDLRVHIQALYPPDGQACLITNFGPY